MPPWSSPAIAFHRQHRVVLGRLPQRQRGDSADHGHGAMTSPPAAGLSAWDRAERWRCGCGGGSGWLSARVRLRVFTALLCSLILFHGVTTANMIASTSTVQKVFGFTSSHTGAWTSSFEVGHIASVLLASCLGGTRHKPRIIFWGSAAAAVSSFVHALPHFAFDYARIDPGPPTTTSGAGGVAVAASTGATAVLCGGGATTVAPQSPGSFEPAASTQVILAVYLIAAFVSGAGFAPTHTLGLIYIDDNVGEGESSSFMIGLALGMNALGPVVGFAICAYTFSLNVNLEDDSAAAATDPEWIGAWWLGYVLSAITILLSCLPLLLFPKHLAAERGTSDRAHSSVVRVASSENAQCCLPNQWIPRMKELATATGRLLRSPLLLFTCLSSAGTVWIAGGLYTLLPKYLEIQFHLSTSLSNTATGVTGPLSAFFAILLSGWVVSKLQLTMKQAATAAFIASALGAILASSTLAFDCKQQRAADHPLSLCNVTECGCPENDFAALCVQGQTFYSPCRAGCRGYTSNSTKTIYTDCACRGAYGTTGFCHEECELLVPYLIVVALITALLCMTAVANVHIALRGVDEEHRSLSLGLQTALSSFLGFIPAPIAFGAVFDGACLYWRHGTPLGSFECLEYDNTTLSYHFQGLAVSCLTLTSLFSLIAWLRGLQRK